MKRKFVVKIRLVHYGYFVVEADNPREAMTHFPDMEECRFWDTGEFVNMKAKELTEPEMYVHSAKFNFVLVTARNLQHSARKLLNKLGRKMNFFRVDTSGMKPLNPKNPIFK